MGGFTTSIQRNLSKQLQNFVFNGYVVTGHVVSNYSADGGYREPPPRKIRFTIIQDADGRLMDQNVYLEVQLVYNSELSEFSPLDVSVDVTLLDEVSGKFSLVTASNRWRPRRLKFDDHSPSFNQAVVNMVNQVDVNVFGL